MFLLDNFVMTTEQWINLKFLVRLENFQKLSVCFSTSLQTPDFVSSNSFSLAQKMHWRMWECWEWSQVWNHLCTFPDHLWLFAKCYFGLIRVHLRSVAQLTGRSPRTIFFASLTLLSFLLVEGLPHLGSSSTSPHPSLNLLCQRETVEWDKVCSL